MHKSRAVAILLSVILLSGERLYAAQEETASVIAYEQETETAESISETDRDMENSGLEHCIVISSDNVGTNVYFPDVPVIAGFTADDIPVDEDGTIIYGWGQDELGYSFRFFGEDGEVLYLSKQNEVALARIRGTSHISLYLNYPDAGKQGGSYKDVNLYFHFVSKDTHLEYAFEVPYLSKTADLRIPVGLYEKCYVTASDGITLPDDYFFPSTCYVQAMKNSHMDFYASTIQISPEIEFFVNGVDPYEATLVLGEADPMLPTAPAVESSDVQPTAGGVFDNLGNSDSTGHRTVNLAVVLIIVFLIFVILLLVMSCIYGMYMYRGRRKERRDEKNARHYDGNSDGSDTDTGSRD